MSLVPGCMSQEPSAATPPSSIPWLRASRAAPSRMEVTLERRVTVLVEDDLSPVADANARVFAVELVAVLSLLAVDGRPIEQQRVRAHISDGQAFAATVIEQMEGVCHTCPGLTIELSHDASAAWLPVRQALTTLPVPVLVSVERLPASADEYGVIRTRRRRAP